MKALFAAATAAALVSLAPGLAQAQDAAVASGPYVNLGYARVDTDPGSLDAIAGRLGFRFNNWIGAEGELATGLGSDSITDPATGVRASLKLKHSAAAYVVGFAPIGANTDLIARVGYGTTKARVRGGGISVSDSEESINYGLGAQHHFDGVNGVRVDWTRYDFDNGGGKSDVFAIAYTRRF